MTWAFRHKSPSTTSASRHSSERAPIDAAFSRNFNSPYDRHEIDDGSISDEDRSDLCAALESLQESSERIPFENVRKEAGL